MIARISRHGDQVFHRPLTRKHREHQPTKSFDSFSLLSLASLFSSLAPRQARSRLVLSVRTDGADPSDVIFLSRFDAPRRCRPWMRHRCPAPAAWPECAVRRPETVAKMRKEQKREKRRETHLPVVIFLKLVGRRVACSLRRAVAHIGIYKICSQSDLVSRNEKKV